MYQLILSILLLIFTSSVNASTTHEYYGKALCDHPSYECIKLKRSTSWKSLYPDPQQREIVQKVNRTYNYLHSGKTLAIPKNLDEIELLDVAPFSLNIGELDEKLVVVDQEKLAWGAYNSDGNLIKWGPISSGKDYCRDIRRGCRTQTGVFRFYGKQGKRCRSRKFRANMPYCMFYHKGFAMHGSHDIPGRRASHGCIRMFTQDAKWLNHNFVTVSNKGNDYKGTRVVVQKLYDDLRVRIRKKK